VPETHERGVAQKSTGRRVGRVGIAAASIRRLDVLSVGKGAKNAGNEPLRSPGVHDVIGPTSSTEWPPAQQRDVLVSCVVTFLDRTRPASSMAKPLPSQNPGSRHQEKGSCEDESMCQPRCILGLLPRKPRTAAALAAAAKVGDKKSDVMVVNSSDVGGQMASSRYSPVPHAHSDCSTSEHKDVCVGDFAGMRGAL